MCVCVGVWCVCVCVCVWVYRGEGGFPVQVHVVHGLEQLLLKKGARLGKTRTGLKTPMSVSRACRRQRRRETLSESRALSLA